MAEPFDIDYPANLTRWNSSWSRRQDVLKRNPIPAQVWQSVARYDLDRVRNGRQPFSDREAALAVLAASGRQVVPDPERKHLGDWLLDAPLDDVRGLLTGLPHLPKALIDEAKELPNLGANVGRALTTPGGLREKVDALAETPVLRLLPGAFVAANLDDPKVIAEHPVTTLLDVFPILKGTGATRLASNTLRLPKAKAKLGRFFEERGLGGETARTTMRQISQAQRGLHYEAEPVRQMVKRKMDELGIDEATGEQFFQWAEHERRIGSKAPDPRFEELVRFQTDVIDAMTIPKGLKKGELFEFEGEFYPTQTRHGRLLLSMNKRIDDIVGRLEKATTSESHWKDRAVADQARLESLVSGSYDSGVLGQQLYDLVRTWSAERLPETLARLEGGLPPRPTASAIPLRPGEVLWGQGVRNDAAQPQLTRELPRQVKTAFIDDNGNVRSKQLDELTERRGQLIGQGQRLQQEISTQAVRRSLVEARVRQLHEDIASTKARLRASSDVEAAIRRGEGDVADLWRQASEVELPQQLFDPQSSGGAVLRGLKPAAADRYVAVMERYHAGDRSPQLAEELLRIVDDPNNFVRRPDRHRIQLVRDNLRMKLGAVKSARATLANKKAYLDADEITRLKESILKDHKRIAKVEAEGKAYAAKLSEREAVRAELEKVGKKLAKEQQRLADIQRRITVRVDLDPTEAMLQRVYAALDAWDRGDPSFVRALGAKRDGLGVTNIEQVRKVALDLEREGWTAPPPTEKIRSATRAKTASQAYRRQEAVKRHRAVSAASERLFGSGVDKPMGLVYQAQGFLSAGDAKRASAALIKAKGEARKLIKAEVPGAEQLLAQLDFLTKEMRRLPSRENRLAAAQRRIEATNIGLAKRTQKVETLLDDLRRGQERRAKVVERVPPARFMPKLNKMVQEEIHRRYNPHNDPEIGFMLEGKALDGIIPTKELDKIYNEFAKQWGELKAGGFDPLWVHHVPPNKTHQLTRSNLALDHDSPPSQVRARALDMAAYERNAQVAMSHQAFEWVQRKWTENFIFGGGGLPGIMSPAAKGGMGWTRGDVLGRYADEIAVMARKRGMSMEHAADAFVGKHFVTLDPFAFTNWQRSAKVRSVGREIEFVRSDGSVTTVPAQILVPKAVHKVIDGMIPKSGGPAAATAFYDKSLNVFRISALAFSPRFHTYNIFGGAIMLMARTGPDVLQHFDEARKMVGSMDDMMGETMPLALSRGTAYVPELVTKLNTDAGAISRFMQGKAYGRIWESPRKLAEKSFAVNEWVDNLYRSMAYLYGRDKSLVKGMTPDEARLAGEQLSNKILQDWDTMLPWERTVLRNIIPFYGWVKHITKYTFTYPVDHPFRASVMSSLVRNELEDQATGLPDRFRQIFWLGDPGPNDRQWTLNVGGANPFADTADIFTWAGFMSQLSPAFAAGLESMGIDMANARSQLFPEMEYDEETGRLKAVGRDPIESVIGNFIPQSESVYALTGMSKSMRQLYQRDPDAWQARIFNSVGVPLAPRRRSMVEERIRAEHARDQAAATALRRAIKTGEWGSAERYPLAFVDINRDRQVEAVNPTQIRQLIESMQSGR